MLNHGVKGFQLVGQTGVTLFFVLSGFLITTILLEERSRRNRIDLRRFFARRGRRLLPALVVMLAVITPLAWLEGHADAMSSALLALFYSADFAAAAGAPLSTVLHTWSLAVEEQFYLVWPLILIGVAGRPRLLLGVALAGVCASAAAVIALDLAGATYLRLLYGPDTRAAGLLLGAALACLRWIGRMPSVPSWVVALGWLGLGVFVISCVASGPLLPLLVVMPFTALIIVAGALERSGWLAWRPLTALGAISYGVYLWDLPLRRLTNTYGSSEPVAIVGVAALTILIAAVSARSVERAFRAEPRRDELGRGVGDVEVSQPVVA
jgi:peptidoglycan/LPS O-acetylase OafA/YrhL